MRKWKHGGGRHPRIRPAIPAKPREGMETGTGRRSDRPSHRSQSPLNPRKGMENRRTLGPKGMKNSIESKNSWLDQGHIVNTQQGHRHGPPVHPGSGQLAAPAVHPVQLRPDPDSARPQDPGQMTHRRLVEAHTRLQELAAGLLELDLPGEGLDELAARVLEIAERTATRAREASVLAPVTGKTSTHDRGHEG